MSTSRTVHFFCYDTDLTKNDELCVYFRVARSVPSSSVLKSFIQAKLKARMSGLLCHRQPTHHSRTEFFLFRLYHLPLCQHIIKLSTSKRCRVCIGTQFKNLYSESCSPAAATCCVCGVLVKSDPVHETSGASAPSQQVTVALFHRTHPPGVWAPVRITAAFVAIALNNTLETLESESHEHIRVNRSRPPDRQRWGARPAG